MLLCAVEQDAQRVQGLERELIRERDRLRTLLEVGRLLDSTLPRDRLLAHVLASAARVTEAERATLYLVDSTQNVLFSHATEGNVPEVIALRFGEGIAGAAAETKQTIVVPDAYADPRFVPTWDQRTGFRTRNVLATPMLTPRGQVVGVLQLLNRREAGTFTPDDVAMLEALAAQAALSIDGAARVQAIVQQNRALLELRRRLERSLRERSTLLEMEQLLARTDSLDEFLSGALAGLARACGAPRGAVALTDDVSARIEIRAVFGVSTTAAMIGRALAEDTNAARAIATNNTVATAEPSTRTSCLGESARAVVAIPIVGSQGPMGAMELRDDLREEFSDEDTQLAVLVAANVATGVELVRAREEHDRTVRLAAVGQTLSNVLHDIRTPMAIISGYTQLMPGEASQDERQRIAEKALRQFGYIQAMVGEVLAFVRGESHLLVQKVILELFFGDLAEVLSRELSPRGIQIKCEMLSSGAFRFDAAKITRLVHNLARNAADALIDRKDGVFSMRVEREVDALVLTFEDNGPGISERVRAKLFHPFVTEGKREGTGLGLANVKKIVDEHNGDLRVETGSWGTRFVVRLPALEPGKRPSSTTMNAVIPTDAQRPASADVAGTGTN